MARQGIGNIFKKGYQYKKAGIILLDLTPHTVQQEDFFQTAHPNRPKLMQTIDAINRVFGKNTVFYAAQGVHRAWQMKSDRRSPGYTTRWSEIVVIKTS